MAPRYHLLTNRGTNGSKRASCGDCVFRPNPLSAASLGPSDDEAAGEMGGEAKAGIMGGNAKESFLSTSSHSSSVEQSSPLLPESAAQKCAYTHTYQVRTYVRAVVLNPLRATRYSPVSGTIQSNSKYSVPETGLTAVLKKKSRTLLG